MKKGEMSLPGKILSIFGVVILIVLIFTLFNVFKEKQFDLSKRIGELAAEQVLECEDSDWIFSLSPVECPESGKQTKTWTKLGNCIGGEYHFFSEEISCDYQENTCTSFNYSNWGECSPRGTQHRTVISSFPEQCIGGNPVLMQECEYIATCNELDWIYNVSPVECPETETQIRTWTKIGNCIGGLQHNISEEISCDYQENTCTSFNYSDWGECFSRGVQYREVISSYPDNCIGGNPELLRSCEFIKDTGILSSSTEETFEEEVVNESIVEEEIFIISDKNWKDVLSLVPIAIYTDSSGQIQKTPVLIFHEERYSFDADSILHFIDQFNPDKINIVGDIPSGLIDLLNAKTSNIKNIPSADISSSRPTTKTVYVEDDYELALMASTYASLINANMIVIDKIDSANPPRAKEGETICALSTLLKTKICSQDLDLKKMQQEYLRLTNTDKVIIVNPNDKDVFLVDPFNTTHGGTVNRMFNSLSLTAPLLAAGKHELLLFQGEVKKGLYSYATFDNTSIYKTNPQYLDEVLTSKAIEIRESVLSKLQELQMGIPEYLTVIASPNNIPASSSFGPLDRISVDRFYASNCMFPLNKNERITCNGDSSKPKTGRIYGLTPSDTSAYIMRSLFYDSLFSNIYGTEHTGLVYAGHVSIFSNEDIHYTKITKTILDNGKNAGYNFDCFISPHLSVPGNENLQKANIDIGCTPLDKSTEYMTVESFKRKQFITYVGHGVPDGLPNAPVDVNYGSFIDYATLPDLELSFGIFWACLTGSFHDVVTGKFLEGDEPQFPISASKAFAANFIRKGGIGFFGNTQKMGGMVFGCPHCNPGSPNEALYYITQSWPLGKVVMKLHQDYNHYGEESGLGVVALGGGWNPGIFIGDPTLVLNSSPSNQSWIPVPSPTDTRATSSASLCGDGECIEGIEDKPYSYYYCPEDCD